MIHTNWKRAFEVFGRAIEHYRQRLFPYDKLAERLPQYADNLPQQLTLGSREHALFLFHLCYWMRGGIKSTTATQSLRLLYVNFPLLFLPEVGRREKPAVIAVHLREHRLGYQADRNAEFWVENATRLHERWQGDPTRIFDGVDSYQEACRRVKNDGNGAGFKGFQEKMVSMLIYFLMDAKLIPYGLFPIPIDFHVLRILIAHEILTSDEISQNGLYRGSLLQAARDVCEGYCRDTGISALELCDALWVLSNTACNRHPGNFTKKVGERNGRKTQLIVPRVRWTKAASVTYEQTCAQCPIESTCRWNIPSAEYYVRGALVIRGERRKPPEQLKLAFG